MFWVSGSGLGVWASGLRLIKFVLTCSQFCSSCHHIVACIIGLSMTPTELEWYDEQ